MNSAGRRKARRAWTRKYADEIEKMITWINEDELYVLSRVEHDGTFEMKPERVEAFGEPYGGRDRVSWKKYLIKRGVDPSIFS